MCTYSPVLGPKLRAHLYIIVYCITMLRPLLFYLGCANAVPLGGRRDRCPALCEARYYDTPPDANRANEQWCIVKIVCGTLGQTAPINNAILY